VSLRGIRDGLNLLQVALAALAVALGGGASTWGLVAAAIAVAIAYTRPPALLRPSSQRLWTLGLALALFASIFRAFSRAEFLDAGVDFLLLMIVQRAFNRARARENMQQVLLGAVLMIIGAVVNAELSYPAIFSVYLPVVSLTVLLTHLLGEAERLGPRARYELTRRGTADVPVLARAALRVAGIAAIGGLIVFLVFPRFGVGAFFSGSLPRGSASGFSDEVQLGGFGRIKTDTTVVMRVKPLDDFPQVDRATWHLRGNAYDTYDRGQWKRSRIGKTSPLRRDLRLIPMAGDTRYRVFRSEGHAVARYDRKTSQISARPIPGFAASTRTLRATVQLDDIGAEFLFAASEPLAAKLRPRNAVERQNRIYGDVARQFIVPRKQPGPVAYEFFSRIGEPARAELLAIGDPEPDEATARYVEVAPDIEAEIRALTQPLIRGAGTRLEKVEAVMDYLQGFEYTLDQPPSQRAAQGDDPLLGFLTETKAGHCEYFATAMAVMLRTVDVPTRNVNGYYGGHWNELGEFYAVRQADAHSWVEVYFDGLGWITFDPTPASGRTAGDDAAWWPAWTETWEAVQNAYQGTVIGFDLRAQRDLLQELGVSRQGRALDVDWRRLGPWLLGPLALLIAARTIRRVRHRPAIDPEARIYESLLRRLARAGVERRPHESALAMTGRIAAEGHPAAAGLRRFAERYDRLRFGPVLASPAQLSELERLADDAVRAARAAR
jgi:transglutaminase-like putative cysteine protease